MALLPYLDAGAGQRPMRAPPLASGQGAQAFGAALADVARVTSEIADARQRSKLRLELSEAAITLGKVQDEIRASGDFEGAEKAFAEAVEKERARASKLRGDYAEIFQTQLSTLGAGEQLRLRGWAREETAASVRANTEVETTNWIARFADTGESAFYDQAVTALEEAAKDRALTPEQLVTARENVLKEAAVNRAAVLRQRDPIGAATALRSDPFFSQVPEALRAQLIEQNETEIRERLQAGYYDERRQYFAEKRARAEAQRVAVRDLTMKAATEGISLDEVVANADALGNEFDRFAGYARRGGQIVGAYNDPAVLSAMQAAVGSGENVDSVLSYYAGEGLLTPETYQTMLSDSAAKRFNPARKWLAEVTTPRAAFGIAVTPAQAEAHASAVQDFERWVQANPEATAKEADEQARAVTKRYTRALGMAAGAAPSESVADRKAKATNAALQRAGWQSGEPTPEHLEAIAKDAVYIAEMRALRNYEQARNASGEP